MPAEEKRYIGIFNDSFPPIIDGVTQTVLNYVDWLRTNGHETCVVTPSNPNKIDVPYRVERYFSLSIPSRKPYRYGYPKLDPYIWGKMRKIPFDLIHSHSPFAAGRLGMYAKRKQGIPLIGTFHSKYKSDLKHSFKWFPWGVPIIMNRILNFYNSCDEVWIPQASVEETVREYGYKGKLEVVANGIDYADLKIENLPSYKAESKKICDIPEDSISLLFVGQHIWEKGIGIIFDALQLLPPGIKYVMTFIGEGYAKKELQNLILKNGCDDRIKTLNVITDREQLGRHYAAADLFLFPSLYDNAPLVVREAASMGTPAIIPEGSTSSEVIQDGKNGFLTKATPKDYATVIEHLYKNHKDLCQIGVNARNSFVKGWDEVMREVEDRYKSLIRRTNRIKNQY